MVVGKDLKHLVTPGPHPSEWDVVNVYDVDRRPSPTLRNRAKFGRSTSNVTRRMYGDPPENGPIASRLSSSLKVIGANADRSATYEFP